MAFVIQNIDETLKVFGESILLHQHPFERPKIYESNESKLWANVRHLIRFNWK